MHQSKVKTRLELALERELSAIARVDELKKDNARLRALIKDREFVRCGGEYDDGDAFDECPWCGADGIHVESEVEDQKWRNCAAFTPGGVVK